MWNWPETPTDRLPMVDRERTLVSVLVDGAGDHPPTRRRSGAANGLVVVLQALWQLEDGREDRQESFSTISTRFALSWTPMSRSACSPFA